MDKASEVGQKMRSAIKAKLIELGCYVDDELPDYIMVMVANRRSKSMMTEDLQLFLNDSTEIFVNWLHQVLQKLQEVTVTNVEISKITKQEARLKRKIIEKPAMNLKKEKSDRNKSKKIKTEKEKSRKVTVTPSIPLPSVASITDEIPVSARKIAERKNSVLKNSNEVNTKNVSTALNVKNTAHDLEDGFDIPSITDVDLLEESDLTDIENKIQNVKKKLALQSDSDDDDDFINIKAEEELLSNELGEENDSLRALNHNNNLNTIPLRLPPRKNTRQGTPDSDQVSHTPPRELAPKKTNVIKVSETESKRMPENNEEPAVRKKSILERLGTRAVEEPIQDRIKRRSNESEPQVPKKKICLSEIRKIEEAHLSNKSNFSKVTDEKIKDAREKIQQKANVHSRIGIMSRVVPIQVKQSRPKTPPKQPSNNSSIPSIVQVKPRKSVPLNRQANKNLLLKAVAEAQKSVTSSSVRTDKDAKIEIKEDTDIVTQSHKKELFTKGYKERTKTKNTSENNRSRNVSKIKNILIQVPISNKTSNVNSNKKNDEIEDDDKSEEESDSIYIPKSVSSSNQNLSDLDYIPSGIDLSCDSDLEKDLDENQIHSDDMLKSTDDDQKQRFIVTLNGVDDNTFATKKSKDEKGIFTTIISNKKQTDEVVSLKTKRTPSPIVFDKKESEPSKNTVSLNEKSGKAYPLLPLKVKERCKYWPGCRQGESCEFVHPTTNCKMFPLCKFGDKCLYIHPQCKFDVSCTRRDCPYAHGLSYSKNVKVPPAPAVASRIVPITHTKATHAPANFQQICKYFPQCTNPQCHFYHPRPCRFGKYCVNKLECNFLHSDLPTKEKLTWRSA